MVNAFVRVRRVSMLVAMAVTMCFGLAEPVSAAVNLTGAIQHDSGAGGGAGAGSQWNTVGGDGLWNFYLLDGALGSSFANSGNSVGSTAINLALPEGDTTIWWHTNNNVSEASPHGHIATNFFFDGQSTSGISVVGPTAVLSGDDPAFSRNPTTRDVIGTGIAGSPTLVYRNATHTVELTDFASYRAPAFATDRVGPTNNVATAPNDLIGQATFNVTQNKGTVSTFTGGDPGEGLDLDGNFAYAVNARGAAATVNGVDFTVDTTTPGFSLSSLGEIGAWSTQPEYGGTASDNALETIMHSIRWSLASNVTMDMAVSAGAQYKVQLLFSENILNRPEGTRVFDIAVDGMQSINEYDVNGVMGQFPAAPITTGALFTQTLNASGTNLNVTLSPGSTGTDGNPIIQAITLENLSTKVGTFTGADPGEGLDLEGNFVAAVNINQAQQAVGLIGDANFTGDGAGSPNVTVSAQNFLNQGSYGNAVFGSDTVDDDRLETVMESIRWSANPNTVTVDISGLVIGAKYKLQMLFHEAFGDRGFDVIIEGGQVLDDFSPNAIVPASGTYSEGVVVTHTYYATDTVLNIILSGVNAANADKNPILNALTLEVLPAPSALPAGLVMLAAVGARRRRR